MQVHVKVDEKEMVELEKLHYLTEAKVNLLAKLYGNKNINIKEAMDDYVETFKEYAHLKELVDAHCRPAEYVGRCKSWQADFVTRELIYEVDD